MMFNAYLILTDISIQQFYFYFLILAFKQRLETSTDNIFDFGLFQIAQLSFKTKQSLLRKVQFIIETPNSNKNQDTYIIIMKLTQKNQTLSTLKKFKFTNVAPAIVCRQQIAIFIQKYDQDQDELFNDKQLATMLIDGLKIPKNELSTVLKEAYQYDSNKDTKLTFRQMIDFITEYYFDELMIRDSSVVRLNFKDFIAILEKTVKIFNTKISIQEFQNIFNDIDQKRTGHISREQYKQFIRDYFGSESHAAAVVNFGHYIFEEDFDNQSLSECQKKIARLIFSQLKVSLMKYDFTRSLSLTIDESKVLLAQIFGFLVEEQQQFLNKYFNEVQTITYEQLMKSVTLFYLCQIFFRGDNKQLFVIKASSFVEIVHKAFYFVRVKPSPYDLQCLFSKTKKSETGKISRAQYIEMMKGIFEIFQFTQRQN